MNYEHRTEETYLYKRPPKQHITIATDNAIRRANTSSDYEIRRQSTSMPPRPPQKLQAF